MNSIKRERERERERPHQVAQDGQVRQELVGQARQLFAVGQPQRLQVAVGRQRFGVHRRQQGAAGEVQFLVQNNTISKKNDVRVDNLGHDRSSFSKRTSDNQ